MTNANASVGQMHNGQEGEARRAMSASNGIETGPTVRSRRPRSKAERQHAERRRPRPLLRAFSLGILVLLPIVLVACLGIAVLYVRLANGPIPLTFLKPSIERQISAMFGGLRVSVSDVMLSLEGHGAQLKLEDVRVNDGAGAPVASAPSAAIQIDSSALLGMQISPSGITLIRPRMHVAYSEVKGLSLSFSEVGEPERAQGDTKAARRAVLVSERAIDPASRCDSLSEISPQKPNASAPSRRIHTRSSETNVAPRPANASRAVVFPPWVQPVTMIPRPR